jgi:hypothetical protein
MKLRLLFLATIAIVFSLAALPASADTLPVQNASFETALPFTHTCGVACGWNTGPIPNWTLTGDGGSFRPDSSSFNLPLPDGSIIAYINDGTISQTLTGTSLLSNAIYNLTVAVGQRFETLPTDFSMAVFAGSTLLGQFNGSTKDFKLGTFVDQSLSFSTGSTVAPGDLSIVLTSVGGVGKQGDFDNVRFTVATPEPSALGLMVAGLLCLGLLGLYKRSAFTTSAVRLS